MAKTQTIVWYPEKGVRRVELKVGEVLSHHAMPGLDWANYQNGDRVLECASEDAILSSQPENGLHYFFVNADGSRRWFNRGCQAHEAAEYTSNLCIHCGREFSALPQKQTTDSEPPTWRIGGHRD